MKKQILLSGLLLMHASGLSAHETWKDKAQRCTSTVITFTVGSFIWCSVWCKLASVFERRFNPIKGTDFAIRADADEGRIALALGAMGLSAAMVILVTLQNYLQNLPTVDGNKQADAN